MQSTRSRPALRRHGILATLGVVLAMVFASTPAHANTIDVNYDVNGQTRINSTGSTINLGPSVIYTQNGATGDVTAQLDLPGTRTQFKIAGFIPVTADVNFVEVGETTGQIDWDDDFNMLMSATSRYHVRLSNIKAVGFPLFAGSNCRTKNPVVINTATPAGDSFDLLEGGRLTGTYSIGDFQNCGLNTWLINTLIPGGGNTIDLNLSNGRLA